MEGRAKKLPKILVCSPFNNEDHSIPYFIEALEKLDYPKELMDLVWIENDSVDETWKLLNKYYEKIKNDNKYNSIKLIKKSFGLENLGKITQEDFGKGQHLFGKNYMRNYMKDSRMRGQRLVDIYHLFFEFLRDEHEFILFFMADCIPQENAIKRFLEVFEKFKDAGWVGGVIHGRTPIQDKLCPLFFSRKNYKNVKLNLFRYGVDEEIILKQAKGEIVFDVPYTAHFFLIKSSIVKNGARFSVYGIEIVQSFVEHLWKMGYKVYCASDIYIKHVSLDGKIYRDGLRGRKK